VIDDDGFHRNGDAPGDAEAHAIDELTGADTRPPKPVRKDERVVADRGLYVEIWLPERRSRRKPLYLLHGELGGSWLWQRFLNYFAPRGWEGHALNLRGHYWSETADFADVDFDTYVDDARAGMAHLSRPPVVIGHGMGGLLALKLWEQVPVSGVVLISPALPAALLPPPPAHVVRLMPRQFRRELIGWDGSPAAIQRVNSDLTEADVMRVQHMMGVESGTARRQMLEGIPVDRTALPAVPALVIGGGIDQQFPAGDSERLAEWLGATYQSFADSHYGLVIGENSSEPVAAAVRTFLEAHRL
jgi:pimeloyl-ACP methyl ester carboxylesterase